MCPVGYVGSTVAGGVWVVSPVRCGCYGVLILLRVPSNRFGWQGGADAGAVAERYTANSSVKGAGEVGCCAGLDKRQG